MKKFQFSLLSFFAIASFMLSAAVASPGVVKDPTLVQAQELIQRAVTAYDQLDNYQANFQREIPAQKKKGEKAFIRFEKPFSIYMHWQNGSKRGLQILYSRGNFDNKILARPGGFLFSLIPVVHMSKDDPRVKSEESHSIDHAGIGYLIEDFANDFATYGLTQQVEVLSIEEVVVQGEAASELTVFYDVPDINYPKVSVAFSNAHGMPVEIKYYKDFEEPVEIYRYLSIGVNVDRENEEFRKSIDRRLYSSYKKI